MLSLSLSALIGQTYAFQHFTDQDGLPSRYMYDIEQDIDGYIWLTGEAGMVWFDGKSYHSPPIQGNLENEVIKLYKDDNRSIWMQDLRGVISLYKNNAFRKFEEITPPKMYNHLSIYNVNETEVWIINNEGLYCFDYSLDSLYEIKLGATIDQISGRKVFDTSEDGNIRIICQEGYLQFEGKQSTFHTYKDATRYGLGDAVFTLKGEALFSMKKGIHKFEDGRLVIDPRFAKFQDIYRRVVTEIREDSNGNLWVLTRDGLIQLTKNTDETYAYHMHLDGEVMGSFLEDYEKNLWFTTSHNGMYKLASTQVQTFVSNGLDKQLRFVKQNKNKEFVLGFDNNEYKVLNADFTVKHAGKLFKENYRLYDFEQDKAGNNYFITSSGITTFNQNYSGRDDGANLAMKSAAFTDDGMLWIGAGDFVGYKEKQKRIKKIARVRSYAVLPISNDEIWFGTIEGPLHYIDGELIKLQDVDIQVDIRDIAILGNDVFCFASQKYGLYIYDVKQDTLIHHLTTQNGLSSNFCSNILIDENFIWLTTKNGLNRINKKDYSVTVLGIDHGIPSNEINGISKYDGKFYIATNKGLAFFDETTALSKIPPRLEFSNIRIAQKDTTLHSEYYLDHDENNISIGFNGITFKNNSSIVYEYQMSGLDKGWNRTAVSLAQYPSIPPGAYTFLVRAKTMNTNWSAIQRIEFNIQAPLSQRLWFKILISLISLGLLWLVYRDIKRRGKQARDLKASQLTAIRAQMNPHFVFNALNSIQEFVVKRDVRSTNRYLSQFARLMRNILNISDKESISLKKEIETLELYLSLEALRFGEGFNYTIDVDQDLLLDAQLPPMLIQPFVENAIKHGLMHKEGNKQLYVRFYESNSYLICEIEDNGIGRERSSEIRKSNPRLYKSKSTSLTQERLRVFNSAHRDTLQLNIEDMILDGKPSGTKVTVRVHNQFSRNKTQHITDAKWFA